MTNLPNIDPSHTRTVLLSHSQDGTASSWARGLDEALRPCGLTLFRVKTRAAALATVEKGGLAAAILIDDRPRVDGITLLRLIRSIDLVLPCWLVTAKATRRTLEAALNLSVCGVMETPTDAIEFTRTLATYLDDPRRHN
ncbi:MAG: response regulator [Planctomycetes bacterium]|nr:response regulator [Planctomycetota bacterium]